MFYIKTFYATPNQTRNRKPLALQDFGSGGSRGNGSEGTPAGGCRGFAAPLPGSRGRAPAGLWGEAGFQKF